MGAVWYRQICVELAFWVLHLKTNKFKEIFRVGTDFIGWKTFNKQIQAFQIGMKSRDPKYQHVIVGLLNLNNYTNIKTRYKRTHLVHRKS